MAAILALPLASQSVGAAAPSDTLPVTPADAANDVSNMELSLAQAVERALRDNPMLIDARLRREVERFDLAQAERRFVPEWTTFTDPEVGRVGLNEQEAARRGIDVEVTHYELEEPDRALADEEGRGFIKVLTPPGKDRILGATIVGHHAGDLLAEFISAMKWGKGLKSLMGTIHIYPTLSEANKFAASAWRRKHAPEDLLAWVGRFHRLRRGRGSGDTDIAAAGAVDG